MTITNDIKYIGVNDHEVDLFEGQYVVPNGMAYNSYAILDEKIAIMDTVDKNFTHQWMDNIQKVLGDKKPDYLVVQHMEPDHSANINNFLKAYPEAVVVSSAKAFAMMQNFFGTDYADRRIVVGEGDTLSLGKHVLTFVTAPMVHWPEVIVTYDSYDKVLFSADSLVLAERITFAPSLKNASAVAKPMPRLPPVMIATLSFNLLDINHSSLI